jgi:hypothetical protein
MILGSHSVVVRRASLDDTSDPYGNADRDWSTATSHQVDNCSVQPQEGREETVGRETVVSRWRIYAPDGTDLLATDRVEWDGDLYEVDGEVQRWDFPPLSHITAMLRRV